MMKIPSRQTLSRATTALLAVLTMSVLVGGLLSAQQAFASQAPSYYWIQNGHSGLCAFPGQNSYYASVMQGPCDDAFPGENEWTFFDDKTDKNGNVSYRIANKQGWCWFLERGQAVAGAGLQIDNCQSPHFPPQRWYRVRHTNPTTGAPYYELINFAVHYCVGVEGSSTDEFSHLVIGRCTGGTSQQWRLR